MTTNLLPIARIVSHGVACIQARPIGAICLAALLFVAIVPNCVTRVIAQPVEAAPAVSSQEQVPSTAQEPTGADRRQMVLVVVGAAGDVEYGEMFANWAAKWKLASATGNAEYLCVGQGEHATSDHDQLEQALADAATKELDLLWVVLLGHGTYDGHSAKFNLRGPDVTAQELADWLSPVSASTVVVNCASASEPFLKPLAAEHRIVVTATRSGYELNFARFGEFISTAIANPEADLDKDDQVSLLEAYLAACRGLQEYYEQDARLMTEHALLDDNGDGLGTPADWFRGVRAIKRPREGAAMDGLRAHQTHLVLSDREQSLTSEMRERRDELERKAEALRDKKSEISSDDYYAQLEAIMIELGRIYQGVPSASSR